MLFNVLIQILAFGAGGTHGFIFFRWHAQVIVHHSGYKYYPQGGFISIIFHGGNNGGWHTQQDWYLIVPSKMRPLLQRNVHHWQLWPAFSFVAINTLLKTLLVSLQRLQNQEE